jgi:hypothetical protein
MSERRVADWDVEKSPSFGKELIDELETLVAL